MFLSIVIPIYNDEKFLQECLDSCLDQELSRDEYEIICVDDGSTDRTREILQDYAARYSNIQLMLMERHQGGRTVGFRQAKGDFVWFVDHDDVIAPGAVDELLAITKEHPEYDRIAFPYYKFQNSFTDEERRLIKAGQLKGTHGFSDKDYYAWSCILRTSFLRSHDIYPRSKKLPEIGRFWGIKPFDVWGGDHVMMNSCYEAGIRSFLMNGRPFYHYRIHAGQAISDPDPEKAKRRALLRRNIVLYRGHRALVQKQRYLELRETDPAEAEKALEDAVYRLRDMVDFSSHMVEDWAWKDCMRRFREKKVFFSHKPRDYRHSLRDHIRESSRRKLLLPYTVIEYYTFTYSGAWLYYRLNKKKRVKEAERIKKLAQEQQAG